MVILLLFFCFVSTQAVVDEYRVAIPEPNPSIFTIKDLHEAGISVVDKSHTISGLWELYGTRESLQKFNLSGIRTITHWTKKWDVKDGYTHYEDLKKMIDQIDQKYTPLAKKLVFGESVLGRELLGLQITEPETADNPLLLRPAVKLVGNIHGDETVGREMLIKLIKDILIRYERRDERIVSLLKRFRLFIIPSLNPDGFELNRRTNANAVDLNRNFLDPIVGQHGRVQPEVSAMRQMLIDYNFVLSAVLHGGDLVANYPFDGNSNHRSGQYHATPEDALMRHLAKTYADNHRKMHASRRFPGGITNGAQWYVLYGGSQDYHYVFASCIELTFELSHVKRPPSSKLAEFWLDNKEALYAYIEAADCGIKGKTVPEARISIDGKTTIADKEGYYFRLLLPGTHKVTVKFPNGKPDRIVDVTVEKGPAKRVDLN